MSVVFVDFHRIDEVKDKFSHTFKLPCSNTGGAVHKKEYVPWLLSAG